MKRVIPLIAFLLVSYFSFAQYENIDLSKYKLPDIKRHQLDFTFNTDGTGGNSLSYFGEDDSESREFKSTDFMGEGKLGYSFYRNSPSFQIAASANTNLNYAKSKNEMDGTTDEENKNFNSSLSGSYDVKYFMGRKQWFLTSVSNLSMSHNKDKDFVEDLNYTGKSFSGRMALGGGIGRIEQVQDYRHAILLLQELEKRGVDKRMLTEDEVLAFSAVLSDLKNKRFFDARNRKQAELEAIHAFLLENGVVDEKMNMNYFVGLEDVWVFGALQTRESGKQLKLTGTPRYFINTNTGSNESKLEYWEVASALTYQVSNPISLKWQSDYNFGFINRYMDKITEKNISFGASKHYSHLYASAGIAFYPNTRTRLNLSGLLYFQNSSDEEFFDNEAYSSSFRLQASAYYYISERLRLDGGAFYHSNLNGIFNSDIENSKYNYWSYSLTLNYAIF
ncbi:hypothetical protein [uncultured Draconibacterium sp.]|uniref:hypothetical protein n=1 Tax=uncultured Draconibacterium sp. TaxID=1573823 RepID=UPI003216E861